MTQTAKEMMRDWKYTRIQSIRNAHKKGASRIELNKRFGAAIVDKALNWKTNMMY